MSLAQDLAAFFEGQHPRSRLAAILRRMPDDAARDTLARAVRLFPTAPTLPDDLARRLEGP